jgi:hypothetical protein
VAISAKIRSKIMARDGFCYHCGTNDDLIIHHRKNRGMGGSKLLDTPSNLITICAIFNSLMESDADSAAWAKQCGLKLASWQDSEKVPVYHQTLNRWFRLGDDWSVVEAEPGGW